MHRTILSLAIACLLSAGVAAGQKLEKPTLDSSTLTPAQRQAVDEGAALHDRGDYDKAVARYMDVLKENPNNAEVLYEIAYAYYAKKDYAKSLEFAYKAAQYKDRLLGAVYTIIGNIQDESGDPKKAVETYKTGIKLLPSSGLLYYNLAITYARAQQLEEARAAAKRAVAYGPGHTSSHLLLSSIFLKGDYKTPALLAACRFLILEPTSQRAGTALQIVRKVMQAGVSQGKNPNEINISIDPSPKNKDEGDFSSIEMIMGLSKAANYAEAGKGKSQMQLEIENFESLFSFLDDAKEKDLSKFTWKYYVPYFAEMKRRKFVEPFVYFIYQRSDAPGVKEWLQQNAVLVREFLAWSQNYNWPKPD